MARALACCLYDFCDRKGGADETQVWSILASERTAIEAEFLRLETDRNDGTPQLDLESGE